MWLFFASVIFTGAIYIGIKRAHMRANSGGVKGFAPLIVLCDSCIGSLARHAPDCRRHRELNPGRRIDVREVKHNFRRPPIARVVKGAN